MPLGGASNQSHPTPYRATELVLDIAESCVTRPPVSIPRAAAQMEPPTETAYPATTNVMLLPAPGGAWCLRSYQVQYWTEKTVFQAGVMRATDWNTTEHLVERKMGRAQTDLPGVTLGSGQVASGDYFLTKAVASNSTYDQALTSDVASLPQPSLMTEQPLQRVASAKSVHDPNTGYLLRLYVPNQPLAGSEEFLTYYFGGPAELPAVNNEINAAAYNTGTPSANTNKGGTLALTLRGDGMAILRQLVGATWKQMQEFRWSEVGRVMGRAHALLIQPFGKKHVSVLMSITDKPSSPSVMAAPSIAPHPPTPGALHLRESLRMLGMKGKKTMTGAGSPRIDMRKDYKVWVQVSKLQFPTTGTLTDSPVAFNQFLPANTKIYVRTKTELPNGTNITVDVKDAKTHASLAYDSAAGAWNSVSGSNAYYAVFTLTGNGTATPYLLSYEFIILGERINHNPTPTKTTRWKHISITGPDIDATHESASVEIQDVKNELSAFKKRRRVLSRIQTSYDANDQTKKSVLAQLEMLIAPVTRHGATRSAGFGGQGAVQAFPSPLWSDFACSFVSMASRVSDQLSFLPRDFSADENAPIDPETGARLPWKLTDIITWTLQQIGIDPLDIDVPDLPIRAWLSGEDATEWLLQPTANLYDWVSQIAREYLGGFICFDANAGTTGRGMWRLILPPSTYTPLWSFYTTVAANRVHTRPLAYGSSASFARHYTENPKPPRANVLCVTAIGEILPSDKPLLLTQFAWNPKSFNYNSAVNTADDPTSEHYLGRFVGLIHYDPAIARGLDAKRGQAAVNWITRQLYKLVCLGERWVEFEAPLALVTDPNDTKQTAPRPLRPYDTVSIDGANMLIRNVNIDYSSDSSQMAYYQGKLL